MISKNKKWYIVINPVANDWRASASWPSIRAELTKAGFIFDFKITEKKRDATNFVTGAIKNGYRYIMSVGGDGTMNESINGILSQRFCHLQDIVYTHIPQGSMNDWSRMHKIPLDHMEWIPKIHSSRIIQQDVGIIEYDFLGVKHSWYFANGAGIGYAGDIAKRINYTEDNIIPKDKLVMLYLASIFRYKLTNMEISYSSSDKDENNVFTGRFLGVNVGIGRRINNLKLTPHAIYDDGFLAISHDHGIDSKLDFLRIIKKLFSKGDFSDKRVLYTKVNRLEVKEIGEDTVYVHADGEFLGQTPCVLTVMPRVLNVLVPLKKA